MRRVLTTVLAVALLLGLGALAVLALPNGSAPLAGAPAVSAAAPEFQDAPLATLNYNVIAMPLNSSNQFSSAGFTYDMKGLGQLAGPGVQQVLKWNASTQSYLAWLPPLNEGDAFNLETGGVYWLQLDNTANNIISFVGDVPAQGSIHFSLNRPTTGACLLNDISIPLDRSDITTPQQLAAAVGNVEQVLQWNATTQSYFAWLVDLGEGDNFQVKIGYPYRLCLKAGGATTWP